MNWNWNARRKMKKERTLNKRKGKKEGRRTTTGRERLP